MFRLLFIVCCVSIQAFCGGPKMIVGIAGGTGSGKTTLAEKIQEVFPKCSILISQDSYYKDLSHIPKEEREKENFDHPDSLDFEMLRENLIALKNDEAIDQPKYNFHIHCRDVETKHIESSQIILVEGILLFAVPEVRELFDLKIYVDADDDIRILRRIERDIYERSREFCQIKKQYLSTVKPMHEAFVAPSKRFADIIIPEGGYNQAALGVILAKLNEGLEERDKSYAFRG